MGFDEAVLRCLSKYAVFTGRARSSEFWWFMILYLSALVLTLAALALSTDLAKAGLLVIAEKEGHVENLELNLEKITIDTPIFFDLNAIIDEFRRLDIEMVPGVNKPKNGPLHGQFTRLLMRLESRLNDRRYDLIFKPKTYTTSSSMNDLFRKILGEEDGNRKKIVVLDLSPVPFDVRGSVISLTLRCLFDFSYWYSRVTHERYPISIFADEVHIYLSGDPSNEAPRASAERIAKEGRKYGISLTVISQTDPVLSSFFCDPHVIS